MGVRTGNPTWQDYPSTATLITAAKLQAMENAIDASPASSSLGTASTKNAPTSGNASATQVVMGNDSRLYDARTPLAHVHAGSDITSGLVAVARLGSGTPDASKFLRGDGAWETPSGGGGTTGSVHFEVTGYSATIGASAFSTVPLEVTPLYNVGGGTWTSGTSIYTIPSNGLYLCLGGIRMGDSQGARNVALGIGIANEDAPHVLWGSLGGSGSFSRDGRQYTRVTRFTTGQQVRLYTYSDGAAMTTITQGTFLTIIKLAA